MARPYILWDPDLLRSKETAAIHGPVTAGSAVDLAILDTLFARLTIPWPPVDERVAYLEEEAVRAGGSTEPARGLGRHVPAFMPSGISFFGADPVHGEPLPSDPCDPLAGLVYPHALLGWRAPFRGWTGSRADGNFQGEWRIRWGDPATRNPGDARGAWTGLVLYLYHAGLRAALHAFVVAHGKRPHDGNWSYLGASLATPLVPGPVIVATVPADGLDRGFVRVVISGASPWTATLECGDGTTWTPLLVVPVDFLALVPPGQEGEVALVAAPLLAAAEVQPFAPPAYPLQEHWVDDLVAPAFAPWVADRADWTLRDFVVHLFGSPPPVVYDPEIRFPRTDLILMPGGSVAAPSARVVVDGFGPGVRFGSASHAFAGGVADARIADPPVPGALVAPLVACEFVSPGFPFALALEIFPEGISSWPSPAWIWIAGDATTSPPVPGAAGLGLYWDNAAGGTLYARAYDAVAGVWVDIAAPFSPAAYEARGTVIALAWTGRRGATIGRANREVRLVVDGVTVASRILGDLGCDGTVVSTVGAPVPDGSLAGFAGVLGRVAWFADACSDVDLGARAFVDPGVGFLNPSFEVPSASGRPGEALHWEWRSLQGAGAWAEYNAADPALDGWRTAGEQFEAGWSGNEGWVDDLVVADLAAALFNAASPTYYGTTESFEIWGYRDDTLLPATAYPGPNWLDGPAFHQPCEEVPPTGFDGWYDALFGTHAAPLAIESFEEAWGTDPLSAAGQPWWPGTAPDGVLRGAPLAFPVTIPPDRNALVLYWDLDASIHRAVVAPGVYASAAALAAALDVGLAAALGPGRLAAARAYTNAQGQSGVEVGWDGATLGAESLWFGCAASDPWNDVRPLVGLATLGPEGKQGAVRYPAALLPSPPLGYASDEVFVLDPWSLLDFYTAYDANCGGWFAVPYGMLGALFDTVPGPGTLVEFYTLTGWVGPTAAWIPDLDPLALTEAHFDGGLVGMESFINTNWPNWLWT
jgi:hypothetical protein